MDRGIEEKVEGLLSLHRAMWSLMAKFPGTDKEKALRLLKVNQSALPTNDCFVCEAAGMLADPVFKRERRYVDFCDMCPLDWGATSLYPNTLSLRPCNKSTYRKWIKCFEAKNYHEAAQYALEVMQQPERDWRGLVSTQTKYSVKLRDHKRRTSISSLMRRGLSLIVVDEKGKPISAPYINIPWKVFRDCMVKSGTNTKPFKEVLLSDLRPGKTTVKHEQDSV